MKRPYSIDYSIEDEHERCAAIYDILDTLERDPSPAELETMAFYILCGKDSNGQNAIQRGEITSNSTRYSTFRRKEDQCVSLDTILDNPMIDQQSLKSPHERQVYTVPKPTIKRPRYDRTTHEMIDPGDSDVPGMIELWESIDRLEHWIAALEGRVPPHEDETLTGDSYRLYKLKHQLVDLRRHQYYLKDAYKPPIFPINADHPRPQFVDWTSDGGYWLTREQWRQKVASFYSSRISSDLKDYETLGPLVKWVPNHHTFDWENPHHIEALIKNYELLSNRMTNKIDSYSKTLLMDLDRYTELASLPPVRHYLLRRHLEGAAISQIITEILTTFGITYSENYAVQILIHEIPKRIAATAQKHHLLIDTPRSMCKTCRCCGRTLPKDTLFFARNTNRKDGWSYNCKECDKKKRIEKGVQAPYDRRIKEAALLEMPPRQT